MRKKIPSQESPRHDRAATTVSVCRSVAQQKAVSTCGKKHQSLPSPAHQVISISLQQEPFFFPSWTPTYHSQRSATEDPVTLFPFTAPNGFVLEKGELSQVQSGREDRGVTWDVGRSDGAWGCARWYMPPGLKWGSFFMSMQFLQNIV